MTMYGASPAIPLLLVAATAVLAAGLAASGDGPPEDHPLAVVPLANVTGGPAVALNGTVALDVLEMGGSAYLLAAAAHDDAVQVIDVSEPARPVPVARLVDDDATALEGAYDIAAFVVGGRQYAAVAAVAADAIQVIDVSEPARPVPVARLVDDDATALDGASGVAAFEAAGHPYLAVASHREGLQIINVTDPARPVPVASIHDDGTLLLGGVRGVVAFEAAGHPYLAVAAVTDNAVQIIGVADPARPVPVSSVAGGRPGTALEGARGLAAFYLGNSSHLAVAAYAANATQIIDITDPARPVPVASIHDDGTLLLGGAAAVAAGSFGDGFAYLLVVGMFEGGIQAINVTDPAGPVPVRVAGGGSPPVAGTIRDVVIFERDGSTYAAVAAGFLNDHVEIFGVVPGDGVLARMYAPSLVPVSAAYLPGEPGGPRLAVTFSEPLNGTVHSELLRVRDAGHPGQPSRPVAPSGEPAPDAPDTVSIQLTSDQAAALLGMADPRLDVLAGAVFDAHGLPVPDTHGLPVNVPDTVPPTPVSAVLGNGLLAVTFSEPLNGTVHPGRMEVRGQDNLTLPLEGAPLESVADRIVAFQLDGNWQQAILLERAAPLLHVAGGAVFDAAGNPSGPAAVPVEAAANRPPAVHAGADLAVRGGDTVALNGTAADPDPGDRLTHLWSHDPIPGITLENATAPSTTFAAPRTNSTIVLIFTLTATDRHNATASDSLNVTVLAAGSPPGPPQNLRAGSATSTTVTLAWDDPNDGTVTGYKILSRAALTERDLAVLVDNTGSADTTYVVRDLDPDTIYVFRVVALGEHGESAYSNFVRPSTAPANSPPTVNAGPDRAVAEGSSVTLSGTVVYSGEQPTYLWTHNGTTAIQMVGPDTLSPSFTAPNVDSDTAVAFTLTVTDRHNAIAADTVTITISDVSADNPPAAPQNLRAGSATSTTITLTWDDPDDATITGYKILSRAALTERDLAVLVDNTGSADTTHTVTGLNPDTIYVFRVVALGEHGESDWSDFVRPSTLP